MPASEAQIRANQANAARSTGPKTPEGKEASSANALKHGLTARKLIPEQEAAEVERRYIAFCEELQPTGELGIALVRLAATMSVRTERCFGHENAMLMDRVRRAEAEFVPPEGVDEATAAQLRFEVCKRAMFDPSKEATLARRYEAAAQRGFFRALTELLRVEKAAKAAEEAGFEEKLGSFLPPGFKAELGAMSDEEFDKFYAQMTAKVEVPPSNRVNPADFSGLGGRVDVPFSIGKPR
jgi:hypothetical protein